MLFDILLLVAFITLVYYGIISTEILYSIRPSNARSNYSATEIDSLLSSLVDLSFPNFEMDFKNLIPYFDNAINSLAYDEDEIDRMLRLTILYDVEPINNKNNLTLAELKYVGGKDLFSDLKDWHRDVKVLADLGDRTLSMTKTFVNENSKLSFLNVNYMKAITTVCDALAKAIDEWPYKANTFPWGENWYQFSVSIPYYYVCIYYLLKNVYYFDQKSILKIKDDAILWIDKLTSSPCVSIGWRRTGPNTILMGVSWMVMQYWKGTDLDKLKKDNTDVQYMIDQSNIKFVTEGEGMRPDGGYYFHTNVRAYGYISSSLKSAIILNCLYENTYQSGYQFLSNIMCHPSIQANLPGLWSREKTIKRFMSPGKLGSFNQYSSGILSHKTANTFIQIMACVDDVAYYESDKSENEWAQAWFQMREMWIRGMPIRQYDKDTLRFMPGIITPAPDYKTIVCPTKTSTTTSMVPKVAASFIVANEDIASLCSCYQIKAPESDYDYLFGDVVLEFTILIDNCRITLILVHSEDSKFQAKYMIECGTILDQYNYIDGADIVRFSNGKNVLFLTDDFVLEDEITILDTLGNTLKEIPISAPLEDAGLGNNIWFNLGLVWYDPTEGHIEPPIDINQIEIGASKRGLRFEIGSYLFIMSSATDDYFNPDDIFQYCILDKDKLDTGDLGLTVAIKTKKDLVAIKACYIPMLFENLPLGVWCYPKLDSNYTGITSFEKITTFPKESREKIPGIAGNNVHLSYYYLMSANDFDFTFKFCIERYRKKVDWSDINYTITQGNNGNNGYIPSLAVREMPNAIACGDGFDPRFYKTCKDVKTVDYTTIPDLNKQNNSLVEDIINNFNVWDSWSY